MRTRAALGVAAVFLLGGQAAVADPKDGGGEPHEAKNFWAVKVGSYKLLPDGHVDERDGSVKGYGRSIGAAMEMAKRRAANKHEVIGAPFQTFGPMAWDKAMNKAGLF